MQENKSLFYQIGYSLTHFNLMISPILMDRKSYQIDNFIYYEILWIFPKYISTFPIHNTMQKVTATVWVDLKIISQRYIK
jgi:hypothetical protein